MLQLQKKDKGKKKSNQRAGKVDGRGGKEEEEGEEEAQRLRSMLYADDAGILSQSHGGLERMTVIVTACSAFELTVSEAKGNITCRQAKYGGKVSFT